MEKPIFSEDQSELIDFLNIILKRKWLIIIPTFVLVVFVAVISFFLPKSWEIDAMIIPSKFLIEDQYGKFEYLLVEDAIQIAGRINEKAYDTLIAIELGLDLEKFPKIKADTLRDTNIVRVVTKVNDIESGKLILNSLFNHLKTELDKKINVEIKGLDTQIESKKILIQSKEVEIKDKENLIELKKIQIEEKKNEIKLKQNRIKDKENIIKTRMNEIKSKNLDIDSKKIEKSRQEEGIKTLNNKFKISEEREIAISDEMKEVKERINKIEEEQRKVLEKETDKNALAILLYSNEIQNNLRYYNTLDEKLSNERITQENLNLSIESTKEDIKLIDNEIEQIKTQIIDVETKIEDIKTEIDDITTQIDNIKKEMDKIRNEITSIQNQTSIIQNEIKNYNYDISFLEERKGRFDYAQMIKKPTSSLYPVFPKKRLLVMLAGVLGLVLFTILAFLLEYIKKYEYKAFE